MIFYLERKLKIPTQAARPSTTAAAVGDRINKIISNSISILAIIAGVYQ